MSLSMVLLAFAVTGFGVGAGYACAQYALILATRSGRCYVRHWLDRQGQADEAVFAAEDVAMEAQRR